MSSRLKRKSNPGPAVEEPEAKTSARRSSAPRKETTETRAAEPADDLESKRLKAKRWAEENLSNFKSAPAKKAAEAVEAAPTPARQSPMRVRPVAAAQRTPSSSAKPVARKEEAAEEEQPNLRRSLRSGRALATPSGPFSHQDDKGAAEASSASDVPPAKFSPKRSYSLGSLLVEAWTEFWDAFWTYYRVVVFALLASAAIFVVIYYRLYLLSPEQVLEHLKSALLLLRDRSIVVLACALGAVVCLYGASALYQRRQKHTDMVNVLAQISKSLLVEFNSLNNGQKVCPVDALMEDSFDRLAAGLGERSDRALLLALWPRVERQVVQDKRVSVAKLEVGGKVQRCWRFLDSRAYNSVE